MSECKRDGCNAAGINIGKYDGCCSIQCRDLREQDIEIARLWEGADWWERRFKWQLSESDQMRHTIGCLREEVAQLRERIAALKHTCVATPEVECAKCVLEKEGS